MTRALALFSGGLDSILACRVLMAQGIDVVALRFITPFFAADVGDAERYQAEMRAKYGIGVQVRDVSREFMAVLRHPAHGFGHNFNPCIDCRIFMLRTARALLAEYGAAFLATGEVLGQRPMSQRRDAMGIIERDSGCGGLLVRPLCAQLLPATRAEQEGLVDRLRLLRLSGRGRAEQKRLAALFGIRDYPAPAGGCLLTDVNLGARFRRFAPGIFGLPDVAAQVDSFRLLLTGRHFEPAPGLWLVLGRNQQDNERILALRAPGDWLLTTVDRPGPLGLLRSLGGEMGAAGKGGLAGIAAGLLLRYARKVDGRAAPGVVRLESEAGLREGRFAPLGEAALEALMV